MSKRKKYPKEFKLDAVSLVLEQGYTRVDAAKSLDINANMLGRWIKEVESEDGQTFRGNGKLTPDQEKIRGLEKRVKHLEMEKDILKKATAGAPYRFFAAEMAFIVTNYGSRIPSMRSCLSGLGR